MAYKLSYLPLAVNDILEAESGLYAFSPTAADKFSNEISNLEETLCEHPFLYQIYEDDDYYRSVNLSYNYRLFYHVDELVETIEIHRVLHGMRDLIDLL
jgi:plasmid stabilization system protein ParE